MARERDDDYDDRPRRVESPGGMDGFFSNMIVAVIFAVIGFCCCPIGVILGGVGLATCKTPEGKKGAMIILIGGVVGFVVGLVLNLMGAVNPNQFK